ncbi:MULTISPECIES: PRD domain-containing protein [unclassified Virgibacillus]|uniref:PRD domain-containing protein n=1 Tax=unclassified Virgibacillus TaxID=2620237 RepID=UPI0024DDFD2D|nr:PRD domain-containing protein [Virgibacillus sp. LDC-1]
MNIQELKERLQLLLEQHVITKKAYATTLDSYEFLLRYLERDFADHAEMLFTHLPMALTRIENGEDVASPTDDIMLDVRNSPFYPIAQEHVAFIEQRWEAPLPKGEKDFLYLHYTTVITMNTGGE